MRSLKTSSKWVCILVVSVRCRSQEVIQNTALTVCDTWWLCSLESLCVHQVQLKRYFAFPSRWALPMRGIVFSMLHWLKPSDSSPSHFPVFFPSRPSSWLFLHNIQPTQYVKYYFLNRDFWTILIYSRNSVKQSVEIISIPLFPLAPLPSTHGSSLSPSHPLCGRRDHRLRLSGSGQRRPCGWDCPPQLAWYLSPLRCRPTCQTTTQLASGAPPTPVSQTSLDYCWWHCQI